MNYIVYFIFSIILSYLFTGFCIRIARHYNIVDKPDKRKVHKKAVPYLGGLAIYFAFTVVFLSVIIIYPVNYDKIKVLGLLLSSLVLLGTGLYDDIKGVNAWLKLILQVVAGFILIKTGYLIDRITNPLGGSIYFPEWLSITVTLFWIVGIINAINLLDGLDGLAGGVIGIASLFIFIVGVLNHNILISSFSIILVGAISGFLFFNFPPAKIFMGDTGSMFLGLIFSLMAIIGNRKSTVAINLLIPIVLLSIPILDTFMAIIRRANRKKNIFEADKEHIHHRLLELGLPYKKVIILIYFFCIYLGLISLVSLWVPKEITFILLLIVGINIAIGLYILNLVEKHLVKRNK